METTIMISETTFIKNYVSFWDEIAPNAKDLVIEINSNDYNFKYGPPIDMDEPRFRSINNMVAYEHFKKLYSNDKIEVEELYKSLLPVIQNFPRTNIEEYNINQDCNKTTILELSKRMMILYKEENLSFCPAFNGCGSLSSCSGDLFYDNTLVEFKAGKRNFTVEDIRQLMVYVLLNSASKCYNIEYVELFNPRTGQHWGSSLKDFILKSSIIPFSDLVVEFSNYLYSLSDMRK
jgi:hypothetical protein